MSIRMEVFDRAAQGRGAFDGGRITEFKVIGMPQDGARRKRIGPLFYWAWARGEPSSVIGLHPHQGFEIFSYVLRGTLIHRDTLGSHHPVGSGGLQLMQTGSGVSHEEAMGDSETEFFQIWLEPHLREAVGRPPLYSEFHADAFEVSTEPGVRKKHLLGDRSPVELTVDASMFDAAVDADGTLEHTLAGGRASAALMVEGSGDWSAGEERRGPVTAGDLVVAENSGAEAAPLRLANGDSPSRVALIDVPLSVPYPLYPNG